MGDGISGELALSEGELAVLRALGREWRSIREVSRRAGLEEASVASILESLAGRGLAEVDRRAVEEAKLTEEGLRYAKLGLPELRALRALGERRQMEVSELAEAGLSEGEVKVAVMWLARRKWATVREGVLELTEEGARALGVRLPEQAALEALASGLEADLSAVRLLAKRKLVKARRRLEIHARLTELGLKALEARVEAEISRLTEDLILSGEWKRRKLRPYNLEASPPRVYPGRLHPFLEFLDEVREILVGMGFVEAKGPVVELEFWNFDVLFQAQDHPAREIHDSFQLRKPRLGVIEDPELAERVKLTHESGWSTGSRGWGYKWSFNIARRLMLRSQTTDVSARLLAEGVELPFKMFCIDRVFRPEKLDATHSMEFYQCEGIVVDEGLNLKHLLGFLREFARQLGFEKVMFKPSYFPFTEPSVECLAWSKAHGWVEVAGSGLFRPEVMIPLGYDYPRIQCLAWGIGISRYAMLKLGIDDIRELHSMSLRWLRERRLLT